MEPKLESAKEKTRKSGGSPRARGSPPDSPAAHRLIALQQQAGNHAVQELLRRQGIQAKMAVSSPGDLEEREADQVAGQIMRAHAGYPISSSGACTEDDESCAAKSGKMAPIQRSADGTGERSDGVASELVSSVLHQESGEPLDAATRAFFEPRFGHDFSSVRLHTGAHASASAQAIQALAYTAGPNIVLDASRVQPESPAGRHLLAHELTHVVQQGSAARTRVQRIVEVRPPGAREATAFDRRQELIDRMNGLSTGVTYALTGQRITYTVTNAANATPFDRQMEHFIDRAEVVPLRLITSAGRVGSAATGFGNLLIDSFNAGYLDLDDMRASDDNSFKMNLIHLLTERFAVPGYERRIGTNFSQAEFDRAHAAGLQSEAQYLRDTIGDSTIRFVYEETKPDGTLVFGYVSNEGYHIFHAFLRTAQAVSGGHVWVQTRDNRRISINDLIAERAAAHAAGRP
jgi:hypothetical protein